MKNVILLTIDTLRKDVLGCYGGGNLTPFLDSLQERSIRFTNAYSGGPYTQAGFPGILTSSYYLDFGRQRGKCPPQRVLVSEVLKKAGITTAAFHSNAYLCAFFGWNRGWDTFYDSMEANVDEKVPYIRAREINRKAAGWLEFHKERGGEKPFFLWVHYMDVHEPYVPERKYVDEVDPSIKLSEDEMFALFKNVVLKRDVSNKDTVELLRKLYLAHVREVDEAAAEFFEILQRLGYHDNSVVIITSDHGEEFGEHGGLSHDGKMYQELVNVPLIIYDPSLKKGVVSETVVSTLDVPPTITHLFGVAPSGAWQGQSLLPLEAYQPRGVYGESIDKQGSHEKGDEKEVHFYREGELKIIYRETDDSWELYDLGDDPEERNNIVDKTTVTEYMMKKVIPRVRRYERQQQ